MRALDHAAACGNGGRAHKMKSRSNFADAFAEDVAHCLFHSEFSAGYPTVFETFRDSLIRAFIFVPEPDLRVSAARSSGNLLARAIFFKRGANVEWIAFHRQDQRKG